jgi:cytochrome b
LATGGVIAKIFVVLIAVHVAAALFHHFVLGDGLLKRMWFGRRSPAQQGISAGREPARTQAERRWK